MIALCLWTTLAAPASTLQDETPRRPFRDLVAQFERLHGETRGLRGQGTFLKVPRDGRAMFQAAGEAVLWFQDSDDTPRGILWVEVEHADEPEHLTTRTRVRPAEAVIHYVEEELAYVLDLSRPGNTPWSWYLLVGPTAELENRFQIRVVRSPEEGPVAQNPEEPSSGSSGSGEAATAVRTGPIATATLNDPYGEDAWILALTPRDRRLRDEILNFTIWLRPDTLLPYRICVGTAAEDLTINIAGYVPLGHYPAEEFEINIEGIDVRRR